MLNKPAFYDPTKSYDDNYTAGPPIFSQNIKPPIRDIRHSKSFEFLGQKVTLPFGIPPGPLLNSQFMKAAFEWGYDVSTYKTVRADTFPCHPFPNVLYVNTPPDLHPDQTPRLTATPTEPTSIDKLNITNSFGVPSKEVNVWQEDVKKALGYVQNHQTMILSFMGTVKEGQSQNEFIADFATAGTYANQTGTKIVEANLSCPNIGNEGLVCFNLDATEAVTKAIRQQINDTPLILKVGYYKDDLQLEKLASIANTYAQAIAAINTLQVEVVNEKGEQALPGKNRMKSGVCGSAIRWAGLEMVRRLKKIKDKHHYTFEIIGIGGVMTVDDYFAYRKAGADLVQSATGAMWNPLLAHEIWKAENNL